RRGGGLVGAGPEARSGQDDVPARRRDPLVTRDRGCVAAADDLPLSSRRQVAGWRHRAMTGDQTFDYIIVGAGSAGCLLANRLSADPSKRVLLIEAGKKDNYHWIHIPVGYPYCIGNAPTDWLYSTEPDAGLNGRSLRYPRGKTLGGCSSINGMIYMRGQSRDYDHWAEVTGDADWSWEGCLPDFMAHEDHYRLDGDDGKGSFADEGARAHFSGLH